MSVRYQVANRYRPVAAPVEPSTSTQRDTQSGGGGATKRVYGPVHDPAWVAGQVALLLVKRGVLGYANGRYYDPETGEIVLGRQCAGC